IYMKQIMIWLMSITLTLGASLGVVNAQEGLSDEKPFADTHIIMQVSDADPTHYQAVLDISNNLTKRYGQEMIDIEVIAFGVGVPMVFAENSKYAQRIASLQEHGVRFYVCGNTLDTLERKYDKRPKILPGVEIAQTGVKFLIDEIKRGYISIHP
ncbi:DsrE family protein, partial [Pseudomonadota bacterium]|nr:DsrE family protein [Pseudomonadota bacterium]